MSANSISWKRVKRLNAETGERFVHATTNSTGEWWWWHCIRHDGTSAMVNTRTGEVERSDARTSTKSLLKERNPVSEGDAEWLAELDRRDHEHPAEPDAPPISTPPNQEDE